ncbi:unnamed protein product, partial [Phaeothamnion confervicola]
VFRAHHKGRGEEVAIKAIRRERLNRKLQENLECEISILRNFRHPNIVELYDIKKTDRHIYLVCELCAGGDLQKFIRRHKRLDEALARHFMRDLTAGLKFLWQRHLIHRDLKPQNLLLTSSSSTAVLKIADFGFARHLATASMAETLCGSPLYMAPEVLQGRKYDAKADLWSVGTILFEMVAGRPPFGGANHVELLRSIHSKQLSVPEDVVLSEGCLDVLRMLLRRDPLQRASFEEYFAHPFVAQIPRAAVPATVTAATSGAPTTSTATRVAVGGFAAADGAAAPVAMAGAGEEDGSGRSFQRRRDAAAEQYHASDASIGAYSPSQSLSQGHRAAVTVAMNPDAGGQATAPQQAQWHSPLEAMP